MVFSWLNCVLCMFLPLRNLCGLASSNGYVCYLVLNLPPLIYCGKLTRLLLMRSLFIVLSFRVGNLLCLLIVRLFSRNQEFDH